MSAAAGHAWDDRRREGLIRRLFVLQLVSMGAMEMSGPFWPIHLRALAATEGLFAFASVAVYVGPMLGIVLTSTFWGRVGDRHGHKLMMIRALAGLALTQLALAFANDIWTILALRFLQGACAGYIAPAQAYGVSIETPLRRARLFAFLQISTNMGSLLGAVAGGLILDHAPFFWINVAAAVLCAACTVTVALALPPVPPAAPQPAADSAPQAATTPRKGHLNAAAVLLLCTMGLLLLARTIPQMPFSLYVSTVFRADNWVVGLCYGLLALGFAVSAPRWARYFETRGMADTMGRMIAVGAACAVLTALAGLTRHATVFIGLYVAWGVLLGATTPVLMALVSREAGSTRQGFVLGLAQGVTQLSQVAGVALGGWGTRVFGLGSTYFLVAGAYALAVVPMVAARLRVAAPAAAAQRS